VPEEAQAALPASAAPRTRKRVGSVMVGWGWGV
jgi:hypothetical protein